MSMVDGEIGANNRVFRAIDPPFGRGLSAHRDFNTIRIT